jgi:hypothetical protein
MKIKRSPVPYSSTLIDAVMDGYVAWREESAGVETAYGYWVQAGPERREMAFAAYSAALDREEHAAATYARLMAIADGVAVRRDA